MPSRPPPQRPAAPDLNFMPKSEAEERILCPLCGSRNQRSVRFCVTCGHLLAQAPGSRDSLVPKPIAPSAPPPPVAPLLVAPPPVAPPPPISSEPSVAAPPPAPVRTYMCPRCHGLCEGPGPFCRFCGQSLTDVAPLREAPFAQADIPAPRMEVPPPLEPFPPSAGAADLSSAVGGRAARAEIVGGTAPLVQPQARTSTRYRLVLVARDGSEGASFALSEGAENVDIGRSEGDVILNDGYVSPRHGRVTLRGGEYFLRDLASTNGIFVRIPFVGRLGLEGAVEQALADQDLFLVGQQVLRFEVVRHADEGFGVASENGTFLFGTPASPRYARLTQRTVEGVVRDVFYIRKAETVIGRESGDIVFTDDPFLSRRHVALHVHGLEAGRSEAPSFALADLGSSNGTFLRIRDEVRLQLGTHFRIGQQLLRFDADPGGAGA